MSFKNNTFKQITEDKITETIKFWRTKLESVEPLRLPFDFTKNEGNGNNRATFHFSIDSIFSAQLNKIQKHPNETLAIKLLAAYKILLYRWSGQDIFSVGILERRIEQQEQNQKINFTENITPIPTQIETELDFKNLVTNIHDFVGEAEEFQEVSYDSLLNYLGNENDIGQNPNFKALFEFKQESDNHFEIDRSDLAEGIYQRYSAKCDIFLGLTLTPDGIKGVIDYNSDLFKKETISDFSYQYRKLLKSISENSSLPLGLLKILSPEEENELLYSFNPQIKSSPHNITILDLFNNQVRKKPDDIAVDFEKKQLTYRELDFKSNQLANYLLSKGIKPESLIPICLDRSLEMIIGIFGILKAGGAYVPIDPTYPDERIEFVFSDTHAETILTTSDLKSKLQKAKGVIQLDEDWPEIEKMPDELISLDIRQNHLAYVIYTSGSTGKPKGVMIEHKGFAASTLARKSYYGNLGTVLLIPSFAFDSSVAVIFGTLTTGGKLILCKSELIKNPFHIKELLHETEAILCVPSYYRFLLEEELLAHSSLSHVIVAGENLDRSLVKLHFEKSGSAALYNEYGPTECTVWASVAQIKSPNEKVTIGKPIDYSKIYILNKDNQLNPVNVTGELCIAGETVSRGYLNLRKLTAEKFVINPFNKDGDAKMYRTGDLARWLPDGNIEYLGRIDDQVKIRGYRIELGEIESTINSMPGIKESAVILREDVPGQKQLVGYVVSQEPLHTLIQEDWIYEIRKGLQQKLPNYMVPGKIVLLEYLPLTANNKIDKKNLPIPLENSSPKIAPSTNLEKSISKVWCKTLKRDQIDINADFFEMGGNSLLAVKVISLLEKEIGSKLSINQIFKHPNISDLAKAIVNSRLDPVGLNLLLAVKPTGSKPPLYIVHGIGSSASIYFRLAKFVDDDQPIYGFQPKGLDGVEVPDSSVEDMATYYISLMVKQNPDGPYNLSGYCFGGCVAYEMAKQLQLMGKKVDKLILFDTAATEYKEKLSQVEKIKLRINNFITQVNFAVNEPQAYFEKKTRSLERKIDSIFGKINLKPKLQLVNESTSSLDTITKNNFKILDKYRLVPYNGQVYLFRAKTRLFYVEEPKFYGWVPFVQKVNVVNIGGHHDNIFQKPEILKDMAEKTQKILDEKSGSNPS
ncbi:non-ribosomal peptide synthetase [Cognataquiflexum rubidum]|uniref:non-ribosomal peptide synthetase n=1 Tax=Cognataquiflexum rubidum TaxID=2922273 RepID=UPI001F14066B|nr:amino acid adenylation domain-containing protein [Cognataquiflexum rubidum]MCH6234724.1 amino acid adenylation domain-containing protein [Cognataquiflexum rubidum]